MTLRPPLTFAGTMDRLEALEATIHPSLNVYRWWRPDMALPALWNWLTPSETRPTGVPACRVDDVLRITVSIGVDPTAIAAGGDMLEVEAYADFALPILDAEVFGARAPLGARRPIAKRNGMQTVTDNYGGAQLLILEFPLELSIQHTIPNT